LGGRQGRESALQTEIVRCTTTCQHIAADVLVTPCSLARNTRAARSRSSDATAGMSPPLSKRRLDAVEQRLTDTRHARNPPERALSTSSHAQNTGNAVHHAEIVLAWHRRTSGDFGGGSWERWTAPASGPCRSAPGHLAIGRVHLDKRAVSQERQHYQDGEPHPRIHTHSPSSKSSVGTRPARRATVFDASCSG
jgi:hypothetical protein